MADLVVYGHCDANCKHIVLTVDQTADLIQEMAANGFQVPEDYIPITAVNRMVEQNKGKVLKFWKGTNAEWEAWAGDKTDVYPIITDDMTTTNLENTLEKILTGSTVVPYATNAVFAQYASEDTSKGTIEERLTSLGFKEGIITAEGSYGVYSSAPIDLVPSYLFTPYIYKQGTLGYIPSLYIKNLGLSSGTITVGRLPEDFVVLGEKKYYGKCTGYSLNGTTTHICGALTITSSGELKISYNVDSFDLNTVDAVYTMELKNIYINLTVE